MEGWMEGAGGEGDQERWMEMERDQGRTTQNEGGVGLREEEKMAYGMISMR